MTKWSKTDGYMNYANLDDHTQDMVRNRESIRPTFKYMLPLDKNTGKMIPVVWDSKAAAGSTDKWDFIPVSSTPEYDWEKELLEERVELMRLPRKRKGKTPIDVGIVKQGDGPTRIRLSMGEDGSPNKKNSDLSEEEVTDLIAMLNYHLLVARGEIDDAD